MFIAAWFLGGVADACELHASFAAPSAGRGDEVQLSIAVGDSCGAEAITTMAVSIADDPSLSDAVRVDYANGTLVYEGQSCALAGDVALIGSQGTLDCARSGIGLGTEDVVLGLQLAFEASFEGEHPIWVDATDSEGRLGWTQVGTFTVEGVYVEDETDVVIEDEGCGCASSGTPPGFGVITLLAVSRLRRSRSRPRRRPPGS